MSNHMNWIKRQMLIGWILLVSGLLVCVAGLLISRLGSGLSFNTRIITGIGILLIGIGIAYLVRYSTARRDPQVARRLVSDERDERTQFIRARAGNRAYWISAAMVYAGLMWASFAANGSLPPLSPDGLWYFLAASVVLPFGVYIFSFSTNNSV